MKTTRKQLSPKTNKMLVSVWKYYREDDEMSSEKELIRLIKTVGPTHLMRRKGMTYRILSEIQDWANVPAKDRLTVRQEILRDIKRKQSEIKILREKLKFIGDMP
jgi:hypothetical protein